MKFSKHTFLASLIAALTNMLMVGATSCAKMNLVSIETELAPYVARFEREGNLKIDNLTTTITHIEDDDDSDGTIVGRCTYGAVPHVEIDRTYWAWATDYEREELVFHELGHCVLNRDHNDEDFSDGCPASIMNTYTISTSCYSLHRAELVEELFK